MSTLILHYSREFVITVIVIAEFDCAEMWILLFANRTFSGCNIADKEGKPAVNFTNVLRQAFTLVDPEKVKNIDNLTVFFNACIGICESKSCT